jgi:hypothetical protein
LFVWSVNRQQKSSIEKNLLMIEPKSKKITTIVMDFEGVSRDDGKSKKQIQQHKSPYLTNVKIPESTLQTFQSTFTNPKTVATGVTARLVLNKEKPTKTQYQDHRILFSLSSSNITKKEDPKENVVHKSKQPKKKVVGQTRNDTEWVQITSLIFIETTG